MFEAISETDADYILTKVLAFRTQWQEFEKPDDVNALVQIFPHVSVRKGYVLDYVQEKTKDGVVLPIQPYARPIDDDSWIPMLDADSPLERDDLVEQLYQYLEFELSPQGLFEYAFFVIELWSMRASRHAAEWLESTPVFTAGRFDEVLDRARKVSDLKRPQAFGPMCRIDGKGGRVRFLVHTPIAWERVYYLESMVFGDGFVDQEAGEIIADMGSGELF